MGTTWKRVVLSLGGGVLLADKEGRMFKGYAEAIKSINNELELFVIVTGGGEYARNYISMARNCGLNEKKQDMMGIAITRVNALLLSFMLEWNEKVPESYEDAVRIARKTSRLVCGGMKPGQSTDKVAADLAAMLDADIVLNATRIEGLYDRHPSQPGARLLSEATYSQMREILVGEEQCPGKYARFDLKAIDLLESKGIPLVIFDGRKVENFVRVMHNQPVGTIVKP